MELTRAVVILAITTFWYYLAQTGRSPPENGDNADKRLPAKFPSEADTLAYVDALKHSNFSQWRSLEEVAKTAGGGSCSGAVNTSVLTALYLLGLFNLCSASPASCCVPELANKRKRRSPGPGTVRDSLPPLLNSLTQNLSSLSLEQFRALPNVLTPQGGRVPVHISVVEQVRKLWDSNPRLLSNLPCHSATEAVRSSFISLSGVASGIILAYSIAQLNQCYPDQSEGREDSNKIWFFPIPRPTQRPEQFLVRSLPLQMPVEGADDPDDGCVRTSVRMRDGSCAKLLSSIDCPYMQWVLLNRETRKGECVPRLCPPSKVFVEADQMCHPVGEPGYCPANQRLYVTAWGEAVCDCEDGMFPGPDQQCHRLYDQAYCYRGTVLQFHKLSKTLVCKTDTCRTLNHRLPPDGLPYAQAGNHTCYQFGSVGPCDDSEKFGFDIETLEPSCVGLEEAGLLRSHKSYQYSHMSFPAIHDNNFPHYEVSYVILNGSTWELEMKTVGREKRDLGDKASSRDEIVIPFLDTREFPTEIADVVRRFRGLELAEEVADVAKSAEALTKVAELKEGGAKITEVADNESQNSILDLDSHKAKISVLRKTGRERSAFRLAKMELRWRRLVRRKRNDTSKRNEKRMKRKLKKKKAKGAEEEMSENKLKHMKDRTRHKKENPTDGEKEDIKYVADTIRKTETKDKESLDEGNELQNKTRDKHDQILLKVFKEDSTDCKWHFSFYSKDQNASYPNSTFINILKHPNFAPFRIDRYASNSTLEIGNLPSAREGSGDGRRSHSGRRKSLVESNLDHERERVTERGGTPPAGEEVAGALREKKLLETDSKEGINQPLSEKGKTTPLITEWTEDDQSQRTGTLGNFTSSTVGSERAKQGNGTSKVEKATGDRDKESPSKREPTKSPVSLSSLWEKFGNSSVGDGDDEESLSLIQKRLEEVAEEQRRNASHFEERELHAVKGVFKVKQTNWRGFAPPNRRRHNKALKRSRASSGRRKSSSNGAKMGRRRRKKTKKARRRKRKRKKASPKDKQGKKGGHRVSSANPKRQRESVETSTPQSKSRWKDFDEESLPEYLRNRGRRQAGTKRRAKLGPGIINAPLLNQCRPGAKRDYNGHCRPRVIPTDKIPPPRKQSKSPFLEPSPPRMKCKGNERLDSRGMCRATLSALG